MSKFMRGLFFVLILTACKGGFENSVVSTKAANVASANLTGNSLVLSGDNLDQISNLTLQQGSFSSPFLIVSQSATAIYASMSQHMTLKANQTAQLLLGTAQASVTLTVNLSGTTLTNFQSTGILDQAVANVLTLSTTGNVGIGQSSPLVSLDLSSRTDSIRIPSGTTAQRPAAGVAGDLRYNSSNNILEGFVNTEWQPLVSYSINTGMSLSANNLLTTGQALNSTYNFFTNINPPSDPGPYTHQTGLQSNVQSSGSANLSTSFLTALDSSLTHLTTSNVSQLTAVSATAENRSTGTAILTYGVSATAKNSQAGSLNYAFGTNSNVTNSMAGGSIQNAYAIYSNVTQTAGTITNAYGLYVDAVQGTNRYSVYANDPGAPSVLNGQLRVGLGSDGSGAGVPAGYALQVVGTAALSTGTAWTQASDRRLKDIQGDYENGLNEILRLKTVRYHYKKGNALALPSEPALVGFIAQDVQKVIPDAVHVRQDGLLELNVDPIHWATVNAVQQLNEKCENQNENLKKEMDQLRQEVHALTEQMLRYEKH